MSTLNALDHLFGLLPSKSRKDLDINHKTAQGPLLTDRHLEWYMRNRHCRHTFN